VHVAILGAGALGRVFGAHLVAASQRVTFVVRAARTQERAPFVVERQGLRKRRLVVRDPCRSAQIPGGADVVLLAVRVDQLDEGLEALVRHGPPVPVVSLTPLLPLSLERVASWVDDRLFVAMPTLAATPRADGVDAYWSFRASPSLFEPGAREVTALVEALRQSGLPARLADDVRRTNPATTLAFFPISVAVSRAGGTEALLRDAGLTELGARGAQEAFVLARRIGRVEPAAALLLRRMTPSTLRLSFGVLCRLLPRATTFVDDHFGTKLVAQHRVLGAEILELGRREGVPLPSLEALLQA
jgi:2-dehydropantoate 2-reductase